MKQYDGKIKQYKSKYKKYAFTLVELIVVITILAVLGTIAFISFQNYTVYARDSARLTSISAIESGLKIQYTQGGYYAVPDNPVEIGSGSTIILKQGSIGSNVARTIKLTTGGGQDPLTGQEYSYTTNTALTKYEILAFFEGDEVVSSSPLTKGIIGELSFAEDLTKIKTFGNEIGVLTNTSGTPVEKIESIQSAGTLNLASDTTDYIAHFNNSNSQTFSGAIMNDLLTHMNQNQDNGCPMGFVKVPGNTEFDTVDFCVAKYEMSYIDATTPDSCNTQYPNTCTVRQDWNTVRYNTNKTPLSVEGKYPITNIKQGEAITACQSIGGHLITNNEWMTIVRNIEAEPVNWKLKTDNITKYLPNGVSNDTTLGCNRNGGNTETRTYATTTGLGSDSACNEKRSYTLSNGEIIWDLAGNVREHVNGANTLDGSSYNTLNPNVCGRTDSAWTWNSFSGNDGVAACNFTGNYSYETYGPKTPDLNAYNGIGRIFNYGGNTYTDRVLLRGGSAGHGSSTGLFTMTLHWLSGNQDRDAGVRCVR